MAATLFLANLAPVIAQASEPVADVLATCSLREGARDTTQDSIRFALAEHLSGRAAERHRSEPYELRDLRLAGGRLFYSKRAPWSNVVQLYFRDGVDGTEQVAVDFASTHSRLGLTFSLGYFAPSNDGKKLAFGMINDKTPYANGVDDGHVHVLDIATQKETTDVIDGADQADVSWLPDGKAFFYSFAAGIHPAPRPIDKPKNHRVRLHVLGQSQREDVTLVGAGVRGSPPMTADDFPMLFVTPGSNDAVLAIFQGADHWATFFVASLQAARRPNASWRKVADPADHVTDFALHGHRLFLLSHGNEPHSRVLELDARAPNPARATVVVPEGPRVIRRLVLASDALYAIDRCATNDHLRRIGFSDRKLRDVGLPLIGVLDFAEADPVAPDLVFDESDMAHPSQFFRTAGGDAMLIPLVPVPPPIDRTATHSPSNPSSSHTSRWPRLRRR